VCERGEIEIPPLFLELRADKADSDAEGRPGQARQERAHRRTGELDSFKRRWRKRFADVAARMRGHSDVVRAECAVPFWPLYFDDDYGQ